MRNASAAGIGLVGWSGKKLLLTVLPIPSFARLAKERKRVLAVLIDRDPHGTAYVVLLSI